MGKLSSEQVIERFGALKSSRTNWESHWLELYQFIIPRKATVNSKRTPGDKRNILLLDNTALHSNELLAGTLHGWLSNPNSQFFELTTGNPIIDDQDDVREWLQKTTRNMHNVLNNSNFQTEVHEYYLNLTSIGTSPLMIMEDESAHVRFLAASIDHLHVSENNLGMIDEVFRGISWNARQIMAEFGKEKEALPAEVMKALSEDSNKKFEVIHAVYPRDIVPQKQAKFPFISQWIFKDTKQDLRVSGFLENPYVVGRWSKVAGEVYGRSPGMIALPDAKTLNKMTETVLKGAQKTVDPPLQAPDDGFVMPIKTRPGSINFFRAGSSDRIEPIFNDARIDFGFEVMEQKRRAVREAFFVDQLNLREGPQMTATEVTQRTEESMRFLGPVLGRQHHEFLRPLIDRVFEIMDRKGLIDDPPQAILDLPGGKLDVQYSSLIARSQKSSDMDNINRFVGAIAPFIELDPQVSDVIDGTEAARVVARGLNVDQRVIRKQKDVEAMREGRAEAEQQASEQQQQQGDAETAAKIGQAAQGLSVL